MKKISLLSLALTLTCLFGFNSVMAQPSVTVPTEGQWYTIVQEASGFYLARNINETPPVIQTASGDYNQAFEFVPVPGEDATYYIKNVYIDEYMIRLGTNAWSMGWTLDPTSIATPDNAKYQIVVITGNEDFVLIKNVGSGSYVGSDNLTGNSPVYANKNDIADGKLHWKIKEYSNDADPTALQNKLNEAIALYNGTSEGTGSDQYPAATRAALAAEIAYSQEVLADTRSTQSDLNDALDDLDAAVNAYRASVYPHQPDVSKTFYIVHSSGFYFTNAGTIAVADYTANQHFQFVAVAGKPAIYNIVNVATGKYMTRDVGPEGATFTYWWGIKWADATSQYAEYQIKSTGAGYYTITNTGEVLNAGVQRPSCLGTDNNTANSGVYMDKSGTDGKHYWNFLDITLVAVNKTVLEEAITKAAEFLTYATRGNGSDQYPAAEYDAFIAAKTAAEAIFADANATQTQVGDATLALNNALAAVIAAVNPLLPDVSKTYYIKHYSGFYFGEYSDETASNSPAIFTNTESTTQKFQFVATAETGVYNIKILSLNKFLTRANDPHLNGEGQPEEGRYDDYALYWGEDAATDFAKFTIKKVGVQNWHTIKCITAGGQRTASHVGADNGTLAEYAGIYVDKSGTNVNHYWEINDINASGVKENTASNAYVFTGSKQLTVKNLQGNNRINIYSVTGQLIASSLQSASEYSKELSAGSYVVVVNGDSPFRGVVIV
ncbi:MAG: RICIN domain-containing protein, partial [Paludibacter sp.]|nr:RICIN domain-containing protein [Paludibacter sp.]